jgi:hypothetical protein
LAGGKNDLLSFKSPNASVIITPWRLPTVGDAQNYAEDLGIHGSRTTAADILKTRVSQSASSETITLSRSRLLYPKEAALDRAPQGASALCCSFGPVMGVA